MNLDIKNITDEISKKGFYSWLFECLKKDEDNSEVGYDTGCPCFELDLSKFSNIKLEINCYCWRVGPPQFKYSGLELIGDYNNEDLDFLANFILDYINEIWYNTDWQYSLNGLVKEYEIKPKYEQTR